MQHGNAKKGKPGKPTGGTAKATGKNDRKWGPGLKMLEGIGMVSSRK